MTDGRWDTADVAAVDIALQDAERIARLGVKAGINAREVLLGQRAAEVAIAFPIAIVIGDGTTLAVAVQEGLPGDAWGACGAGLSVGGVVAVVAAVWDVVPIGVGRSLSLRSCLECGRRGA